MPHTEMLWSRVVSGGHAIERVWPLTPYEVEIILEDVRQAGREARVELMVSRDTSAERVASLRRRFGRLHAQSVEVKFLDEPGTHPAA